MSSQAPRPAIAYKVLTAGEMAALEAEGTFAGSPVDLADGYIHMSTAAQLDETVAKHFGGQAALHLVAVDLDALGEAVKWELSRGDERFPHLYCALPLSAVIAYGPLHRDSDGTVKLPVAG